MTQEQAETAVSNFLGDAHRIMEVVMERALRKISKMTRWQRLWRASDVADKALGLGWYWDYSSNPKKWPFPTTDAQARQIAEIQGKGWEVMRRKKPLFGDAIILRYLITNVAVAVEPSGKVIDAGFACDYPDYETD